MGLGKDDPALVQLGERIDKVDAEVALELDQLLPVLDDEIEILPRIVDGKHARLMVLQPRQGLVHIPWKRDDDTETLLPIAQMQEQCILSGIIDALDLPLDEIFIDEIAMEPLLETRDGLIDGGSPHSLSENRWFINVFVMAAL